MSRLYRLDALEPFQAVNLVSDPGYVGGKLVIPQAAQISIVFTLTNAKTAFIVLYGRYTGVFDTTQAEVDAMSTAVTNGTAWSTLAGFLAPSFQKVGLRVRDVNQADQPIINAGGNAPGTSTGTALPDETALVITFRTAKAGQSGRGRAYFPGFASNALGTSGTAAAAAVTALTTWANTNIPLMMTAGQFTHCLGLRERAAYTSPITGTQHPARLATTLDVTSRSVNNQWDSQRRRGLG